MSIFRRNISRKLSESRIPSEYKEVQYIQFDGNQYLLLTLNSVMNQTCRIECKVKVGAVSGTKVIYNSTNAKVRFLFGTSAIYAAFGANRAQTYASVIAGVVYEFVQSNASTFQFGDITVTNAVADFTTQALQIGADTGQNKFIGNYYYFNIVAEDNTYISSLVPCIRKADNVVGMYDLVSEEFFTNKGTGTIIAGPEV